MRPRVLSQALVLGACVLAVSATGSPAATPRIAFDRSATHGFRADTNVFTIAPSGAGPFQVSRAPPPAVSRSPDWSPSRGRVVFVSDRSGSPKLWIIGADGAGVKKLTKGDQLDDDPAWSPDGRLIAFSRLERVVAGETLFDVYSVGRGGSGLRKVSRGRPEADCPDWSPTGERIAFRRTTASSVQVWTMRADGSDRRKLTSIKNGAGPPAWSPNGKLVAFASVKGGTGEIFVVPAGGGSVRQVTSGADGAFESDPAWSPNSKRIVFATRRVGVSSITSIKLDGSDRREVIGDPSRTTVYRSPSWG